MKFGSHRQYDQHAVTLTEQTFLTVWAGLGPWHEELVLVGGLVPLYLCGDTTEQRALPRPVTLDTDLGIKLGATCGQYGTLSDDLRAQGFVLVNPETGPRFEKRIGNISVPVDFLVEHSHYSSGTATVDDIPANILPGIDRALATARAQQVTGIDLYGSPQTLVVRVCEAGPFIALKLRAFLSRQQPKDAFDVLYTMKYYDGGTDKAVEAFAEECKAGNPACPDAIDCLKRHFQTESSSAPMRAAQFVYGDRPTGLSLEPIRIQQEMMDAGTMLKNAVPK